MGCKQPWPQSPSVIFLPVLGRKTPSVLTSYLFHKTSSRVPMNFSLYASWFCTDHTVTQIKVLCACFMQERTLVFLQQGRPEGLAPSGLLDTDNPLASQLLSCTFWLLASLHLTCLRWTDFVFYFSDQRSLTCSTYLISSWHLFDLKLTLLSQARGASPGSRCCFLLLPTAAAAMTCLSSRHTSSGLFVSTFLVQVLATQQHLSTVINYYHKLSLMFSRIQTALLLFFYFTFFPLRPNVTPGAAQEGR